MTGKERHKLEAFGLGVCAPVIYGIRLVWDGRDLKNHLVPPCCLGQEQLPLAQVALSSVQPGLGHVGLCLNFLEGLKTNLKQPPNPKKGMFASMY